jgi:hypothetical protein
VLRSNKFRTQGQGSVKEIVIRHRHGRHEARRGTVEIGCRPKKAAFRFGREWGPTAELSDLDWIVGPHAADAREFDVCSWSKRWRLERAPLMVETSALLKSEA